MTTSYTTRDDPAELRLTLVRAIAALESVGVAGDHRHRLQRLVDSCDQHRPIDKHGRHGNRHTMTCGCDRDARMLSATPAGNRPRTRARS